MLYGSTSNIVYCRTNNCDSFTLFSHSVITGFFLSVVINEPVKILIAFDAHILLLCMVTSIGNFVFEMTSITNLKYHVMSNHKETSPKLSFKT
jgi:hypothetical protein